MDGLKDNCIGATPQPNPRSDDWITFYRESRLDHQFSLAEQKGKKFSGSKKLMENLEFFLRIINQIPVYFTVIFGEGIKASPKDGSPLFLIRQLITEIEKLAWHLPICLVVFHMLFIKVMKQSIHLTKDSHNKHFIIYIMNLITLTFGGGYANSAQASLNKLLNQIFER